MAYIVMDPDSENLLRLVEGTYKSQYKRSQYEGYINSLAAKKLPVILSFRHLADIIGLQPAVLHGMSFRSDLYYKTFEVPKRSGGARIISAPHESLAVVQRWIAKNIISQAHPSFLENVVGYVGNKSIKDHVAGHANSEQLVKFDLKDFFPSIRVEDIRKIFLDVGYVRSVSRTLAALVTLHGALPQGASTSPILSNIFMRPFDDAMRAFCDGRGFLYTRYADDIVISGDSAIAESMHAIKEKFAEFRLTLNHAKTRVYKGREQVRFVTGLILCDGRVRLPKSMRRRIRVQCHLFLSQLEEMVSSGPLAADAKIPRGWRNRERVFDPTFPERILGKLNYWLFIEPENAYANQMRTRIHERLSAL